jgi:hypothetical protein
MRREQIESALASGHPFALQTAQGKTHAITRAEQISLPPHASYAIVWDNFGGSTVVFFEDITGVETQS